MGKASKWIRNLMMGKREDKEKKTICASIPPETHPLATPVSMALQAIPSSSKIKRRWSFKRSNSTKPTMHKSSKSFDSIPMTKQALLEYETREYHTATVLLNAHAAATKIQAAYRSYLARRALRALRGLVKIQALARGHLVRKQMTAVIRSMHAVMAIQVRARIHRVKTAEEPLIVMTRKSCGDFSASDCRLRKETNENIEGNIHQTRGSLRSRSARIQQMPTDKLEHSSRGCNSGRRSVSRTEYYHRQICPTPSTLSFTDSSSMTNDGQLDEFSFIMAQRNSKLHSLVMPEKSEQFTNPLAQCPGYIACNSSFVPNYMTTTKSSKAKSRSESEPRRRPKQGRKQKSRRTASMDGKNDKENEYPWLIRLYRSDKFTNEVDIGSSESAMTTASNKRDSLMPFHPPESLY